MHLDVATGGELHVALAAGVPGRPPGAARQQQVARGAARGAGGRCRSHRVDSFDELDRLAQLHAEDGLGPKVLVRATPGVEAHTHDFIRTGQVDSKFGFGVAAGDAARAVARAQDSPAVDAGRRPHAHRQPGVRRRLLPRGGGGGGAVGARGRSARALDRRRPRRGLRRGRGRAVDHASGAPPSCRGAATPASRPGWPPSPAGRSSPRRPSPSTRSARSRTCPTCAPTCRSTAACPTTRGRCSTARATRRSSRGPPTPPRPKQVTIVGKHCESGDVLVRDAQVPARPGGGRRPGHAGHRRLRPLDGLQLQQGAPPGRGVRGRGPRPRGRAAGDLRRPPPPRRRPS